MKDVKKHELHTKFKLSTVNSTLHITVHFRSSDTVLLDLTFEVLLTIPWPLCICSDQLSQDKINDANYL